MTHRHRPVRRRLALALLVCLALPAAHAQDAMTEAFVASDIRVDGLQRIAAGTVFTYLPIERGDRIDTAVAGDALRALYRTGFFEDVRLERQGNVLVVRVTERPAINTLTLSGNKDIKSEDLLKGLAEAGLREGDTFDRLALQKIVLELTRQYNNRGKYNVEIAPKVTKLGRNRVDVAIDIVEGKAAKIGHINLVGNTAFEEDALRDGWEMRESNWLSWYRRDDQYSREKLSGDLERLNSYYLDRGYVDFALESTQVAISPDRRSMYVTAQIVEGEPYDVASVTVEGDTVLPVENLQRLVLLREGQRFSRVSLEVSADAITAALGNIGYAFAEVDIVPTVDRDKRTVAVALVVKPGARVTVRRIAFEGHTRTADEVLRRELRQFEGAWYSQAAIDRSRIRLQRLGAFETVEVRSTPVPDTPDRVDLTFTVKETTTGSFQVGLGYSQDSGATLSFQLEQRNFLGSGRALSINLARNDNSERYGFSVQEPWLTDSGVGLGYGLNWTKTRQDDDDDSSYDSRQGALNATATIPLTETNAFSLGGSVDTRTLYLTEGYYPQSYFDFLDRVGDTSIFTWRAIAAWSSDSRNDALNPTGGTSQRVAATVALPGSDVTFYKLDYEIGRYWPMGPLLLLTRGELGYADTYGSGDRYGVPFYESYYAGGSRSVRAFRENSLGPCEYVDYYEECRPIGGTVKVQSTFELSAPRLFGKAASAAQAALFLDVGNVFNGVDNFDERELRASTGFSLRWRSPMGPLSISYGLPIRREDEDEVERLQFSFGSSF